jgi:hypothetical protein
VDAVGPKGHGEVEAVVKNEKRALGPGLVCHVSGKGEEFAVSQVEAAKLHHVCAAAGRGARHGSGVVRSEFAA